MTDGSGAPVLLFVAGDPHPTPDPLRDVDTSILHRAAGVVVGGFVAGTPADRSTWKNRKQPQTAERDPWHLPREQNQCVLMVLEIADEVGRAVRMIDVNRASSAPELIARWVGPDDVMPLLVRPDGARLEGLHELVPGAVRRFLRSR
jgi:hypothetical protein